MPRLLLILIFALPAWASAQSTELILPDTSKLEVVYDQPHKVRRFYVGFQPVYADAFKNGVNAGFGMDAYFLPKGGKFDLHASFRKPYSTRFFDQVKDNMDKTSNTLNQSVGFALLEIGGTIHLKDETRQVPVKVAFIKKDPSLGHTQWLQSSTVTVPGQLRTIQGVRIGMQAWRSAIDVTNTLDGQGSRNADVALPEEITDDQGVSTDFNVFSNLYNRSIFAGFGITQIRNQAVLFEGFETAVQDKIVTYFADLMVAPWLSLDDAAYGLSTYSLEKVKLRRMGLRLGTEVKLNRKLGWSYGAELGWRPAPRGNTGFLLVKISVPVFAGYLVKRN